MNTAYLDPLATLEAIKPMEHVLGKSKVIAATNNYHFSFDADGTIRIEATDSETWLSATLSQKQIQEDFELLLPGRELSRILANSLNPIEVSASDRIIRIVADGSKYQFNYTDPNTFPSAPPFGENLPVTHRVTLDQTLLPEAFRLVNPAVSKSADGMSVPGVGIFHGADFLMLASASSLRFANTRLRCTWEMGQVAPINIIAIETAKALATLKPSTPITMESTDNMMRFSWDKSEMLCRTLSRKFPPIKQFLPTGTEPCFAAKAAEISAAIKKVAVVEADIEDSFADHGDLSFSQTSCHVAVRGKHGQAESSFAGDLTQGDPYAITIRLSGVSWLAKSFADDSVLKFYLLKSGLLAVTCGQTVITIPPRYTKATQETT